MKLFIPEIANYNDYRELLRSFYECNFLCEKKLLSYRQFCQFIGWPNSLLIDIIHGRKNLSTKRAIEFGKWLELSNFQINRIIWMTLAESNDVTEANYFAEVLKRENDFEAKNSFFKEVTSAEIINFILIHELIKWETNLKSVTEICEIIPKNFNLSEQAVQKIIDTLLEKGIVEFRNGSFQSLMDNLEFNTRMALGSPATNIRFLENTYFAAKQVRFPCIFQSGFVEIHEEDLVEVNERLLSIRNWLASLGHKGQLTKRKYGGTTNLFQYDLNVFPLIHSKKSKFYDESDGSL